MTATMLGLTSGQLYLAHYQASWPILFQTEKERLVAGLGDAILDVQHIGSTAIPGMMAKPILDIGIAVANFEEAAGCVQLMERLGYVYKGENGIPRRHYFVKGEPRTHHLHMLESTSQEWKNHLHFRDVLRANPALAAEYASLKQKLVAQFAHDRAAYQNGKDEFIQRVLL